MTNTPAITNPTHFPRAGKVNGEPVGFGADHATPGWVAGSPRPVGPPGPEALRVARVLSPLDVPAHTPTPTGQPTGLAHAQPTQDPTVHDADLAKAVRHAGWIRRGFYTVVLGVALGGQVSGLAEAAHLPLYAAVPCAVAIELGGVVVFTNADVRRRVGERAYVSRALSAGIAVGGVAFNWLAHHNHLLGAFLAGMSALGYAVWVMDSENRRRDRLRAKGDLPPTTPAYEIWGHWIRHPWITMRAKSLAKADPGLGLYDSIEAARTLIRRERRDKAISKVLHRKIRSAVDPTTADIAVEVYDLDEVAAHIAATADYAGLAGLVAEGLTPDKLGAHEPAQPPRRVKAEVGRPIRPAAQPKRRRPAHGRSGRAAQPNGRKSAQPTDPPKPQPTPNPTGSAQLALGGLTDAQRQRLTDLAHEFPGDLPGRDKVMAHMKAKGYVGWSSKVPAGELIALLKSRRATSNGDPQ